MKYESEDLPANAYCEGSFIPVPAFDDGHLASHVASWSVEDFVGVAVVSSWGIVGVAVGRSVVRVSHCSLL